MPAPSLSKIETILRAVRLGDPLLVNIGIPPEPEAASLMRRACLAGGLSDEATVQRIAERHLRDTAGETLLQEMEWLCRNLFTLRRGLPILRGGLLPRQVARLVAPDALLLFHPELRLEDDDPFDWGAVPMPDGGRIGRLLRERSLETHIHLGGTLTPMFYWLPLVGGGMHLDTLRRTSSLERGYADDETWQEKVGHATWARLWIAAWLEREAMERAGQRLFPWLAAEWCRVAELAEEAAPPPTPDDARELAFDIGLEFRLDDGDPDEEPDRPFPDPLRPHEANGELCPWPYGERRFLYLVAQRLRRAEHYGPGSLGLVEERLREYLQVRNAFHRLLVHDRGEEGLLRFVQNFRRRRILGGSKRGLPRRGRRQIRYRRLVARLERLRMKEALDSQLVDPFDPPPVIAWLDELRSEDEEPAERRLEMRVSVPPTPVLVPTLVAWLEGLRDHLVGSRGRVRNSQVGLLFHLLKTGTDEEAEERATMAAERLVGALEEFPWLRPFVIGLDAAGQERRSNPRTFLRAFEHVRDFQAKFRRRADEASPCLGYTFHVGEDVEDLLTGLRHIDEVVSLLLPADEGGRLGHALALGDEAERFYDRRGTPEPPRGSHLLDLVWAWGRLTETGDADGRVRWLESKIQETAGVGRKDLEILECYRSMGLGHSEVGVEADLEILDERALLERLVPETARRGGFPFDPESPWPVPLGPEWMKLVEILQGQLRDRIARRPVCVEANPTSNLLIGAYRDYSQLPYARLVEDGLAVSVNTDDPGLFMTTLPGELAALYEALESRGEMRHREILDWLRDRLFDAEQSTFLGLHVPRGKDARRLLDRWRCESDFC